MLKSKLKNSDLFGAPFESFFFKNTHYSTWYGTTLSLLIKFLKTLYIVDLCKQLIFREGDKNSTVINYLNIEHIPAVNFIETNYVPVF